MPIRNVDLSERSESLSENSALEDGDDIDGPVLHQETAEQEQAKLEWLRSAAKEGFDELDRGEGIRFNSMDDFAAHIKEIYEEVVAEIAAER